MHMLKHVPVLPLDRGLCIPMVLAETVAGMSEGAADLTRSCASAPWPEPLAASSAAARSRAARFPERPGRTRTSAGRAPR